MIGGGGEQRTLKIVAKYADSCNLVGSIETIQRKLSILHEHCNQVGTNYNSILKTKLSRLIIDKNEETLEKRLDQAFGQMPEKERHERTIYGTPDTVRKQVESYKKAGIEYMIFNFQPNYESQDMELFAQEIIQH
jgi:alkanesulfonate monooxygenase SsuD/methylene tetrahydromethanopterin reductase-like flavin-dependent oxidoreductase (luciferase family)